MNKNKLLYSLTTIVAAVCLYFVLIAPIYSLGGLWLSKPIWAFVLLIITFLMLYVRKSLKQKIPSELVSENTSKWKLSGWVIVLVIIFVAPILVAMIEYVLEKPLSILFK